MAHLGFRGAIDLRLRTIDPFVVTGGQMLVSALLVLPAAMAAERFDLGAVSWRGWLAVGYNGVVGSYIAFFLIISMIQRLGVATAALSTLVQPMAAALIGSLLLDELITTSLLVGALLVLSGVFLAAADRRDPSGGE